MIAYIYYLNSIFFVLTNTQPEVQNGIKIDTLLSGLIGSLIGVFVSSIVSFWLIKTEKKYFIELEVIADKILNPLMIKYEFIKERQKEYNRTNGVGMNSIIPTSVYDEILNIFKNYYIWIYAVNENLSLIFKNINDYSKKESETELISELEKLEQYIIKNLTKKYR